MCRILGSINCPFGYDTLDTIKHGGPDAQKIVSIASARDRVVTMGHARLAIVDLSDAGSQPMTTQDGRFTIIFNGEIYNHKELRENIKFRDFRSHSDTETLLYYLAEHGAEGIADLNGIFAFALYDNVEKTVLLARDPFGVKPLYYAVNDTRAVFASEIRPIKKLIPTSMNVETMPLFLNMRHLPSPYTMFNEIRKLRPGHYGIIRTDEEKLQIRISAFIHKSPKQINISFDDALEEYGRLIKKAVSRQMMGDVDVGVLLSGGVDSALVAAIASRSSEKRMKAFTVGFENDCMENEIGLARDTAEILNLEQHVVTVNEDDYFNNFAECCRIVEEPIGADSTVMMYHLSKLASQNVKVVLTGQGADEPLGGYFRYQGEYLRERIPGFVFKTLKTLVPLLGIKQPQLLRGARSLAISDDVKRILSSYSVFTDDEIFKLSGLRLGDKSERLVRYFNDLLCRDEQSALQRNLVIDSHMDLADNLLLYTDKLSMNFALETRVPLLDLELVNFIDSLPIEYKVGFRKGKIIHKAFARTYLPKSIIDRKKRSFAPPSDIWFRDKKDVLREKLFYGKLSSFLDKNEMERIFTSHINGEDHRLQLFLLLVLNEWLTANT